MNRPPIWEKVKKIKNDYFFNFVSSSMSFSCPHNFTISDDGNFYISLGNSGQICGDEKGSIINYDIKTNMILKTFPIPGIPLCLQYFSKDRLLFFERGATGIKILNLITGNVESFINNEEFVSISSIEISDQYIYITDIYGHKIFRYSKNGNLIDVIDLKESYEFPSSLAIINGKVIFTNFNKIGLPNSYSKLKLLPQENLFSLDIKSKNITPLYKVPSSFGRAPISIVDDKKGNCYYVLSNHYLCKFDYNNECLYTANLNNYSLTPEIEDHKTYFYKINIWDDLLYILEIGKFKKIFSFKVKTNG